MSKRRFRGLFCCEFASASNRSVVGSAQVALRWLAAVGYLVLALGIPISVPGGKRTDQPYPCMNHPCGCQSAEDCWRHCCCFTLPERLAWARDNHVTPPEYALAEARAMGIDWQQFCAAQANDEPMCCACQAGGGDSSCEHAGCRHSGEESLPAEASSTSVVIIQALRCQGADQNWFGLSISLLPPAIVQIHPVEVFKQSICTASKSLVSISHCPPKPPPRSVFA